VNAAPPRLVDVLEVENDPAIMEFRCASTDIALWPLIRVVFNRMLISDLMYSRPLIDFGIATAGLPLARACSTLARSWLHNMRHLATSRSRAEICILTDSLGLRRVEGKWFNRLSDYFALSHGPQTLVLEEQFNWVWPMPRAVPRVIFHAPWQVSHYLSSRLRIRSAHRQQAAGLIQHVIERSRRLFGWEPGPEREGNTVRMMASKIAGLPGRVRTYDRLLAKIEPRMLLVDSGCYGTTAALIRAARDRGIATAEFQHGAVGGGHDAYNVAPALRESAHYRAAMPDYFLAYGQWWSDQITAPVDKIVIGNPHRDAQVAEQKPFEGRRRDVLVLGDGIEWQKYFDFCRAASRLLRDGGLRIVFRPHPLERMSVESAAVDGSDGVHIDRNNDIYQSLNAAHAVVSEQSSGLFEAIGLTPHVFVWNTPKAAFGFPTHPFFNIDSPEELTSALLDPAAGLVTTRQVEDIWAPGWRDSYERFLRSNGVELRPGGPP
jgi:hypothetical protein